MRSRGRTVLALATLVVTLARCSSGDTYRVYVDAKGRVVVVKQ